MSSWNGIHRPTLLTGRLSSTMVAVRNAAVSASPQDVNKPRFIAIYIYAMYIKWLRESTGMLPIMPLRILNAVEHTRTIFLLQNRQVLSVRVTLYSPELSNPDKFINGRGSHGRFIISLGGETWRAFPNPHSRGTYQREETEGKVWWRAG